MQAHNLLCGMMGCGGGGGLGDEHAACTNQMSRSNMQTKLINAILWDGIVV